MTLRLDADEAAYQEARAKGDMRPLPAEELVREFRYWRIVKNRFPHTKLAKKHHMIVLKRSGEIDSITIAEWKEFLHIIQEIQDSYDNLMFNLPSMTSIRNLPHFHLYCLKEEFNRPPKQQALEVT